MDPLLIKHAPRGIVIDTNILLLYAIGLFDRSWVGRYKRIERFTPGDFDRLVSVLSGVRPVVTTPHILAEVSNLAGHLPGDYRRRFFVAFASMIPAWDESYVPSAALAGTPPFVPFGLADAALADLARAGRLILTDNFRLSQTLQAAGYDALNFNHLRPS